MNKNRFKLLSIILSYVFFFCNYNFNKRSSSRKRSSSIRTKEILVKKVDNNFLRDKNSVYEILEKDNHESKKSLESRKKNQIQK